MRTSNVGSWSRRFGAAATVAGGFVFAGCDAVEPKGPGSIDVKATATTGEPFGFSFGISIDSGTAKMGFSGTQLHVFQAGLAHGAHDVSVVGVNAACTGVGNKTVTLNGDDTAKVTIAIVCPRTTGDIAISVQTAGFDFDANGYTVQLFSTTIAPLAVNGSTSIKYLPPGTYPVSLGDVASNCLVASNNKSAVVTAGGTANIAFDVTCDKVAYLRLAGAISGPDRDPDGFALAIDGGTATQYSGALNLVRITPGVHTWALGDVQPNCSVAGGTSGGATVAAGDTVSFDVTTTCGAIPAGTQAWIAADPASDTLTTTFSGSTTPHDVLSLSGRYATGWLTLVMRFKNPIGSSFGQNAQGLFGVIDLDTDESASTGQEPLANSYGGSAQMGADYSLQLSFVDSVSTTLIKRTANSSLSVGRVRTVFDGDSVMFQIPIEKLGNDDGNMRISSIIGTQDRPTDIVPNSGYYTAVKPSSNAQAPASQASLIRALKQSLLPGVSRATGAWVRFP
jgi:hypothetical protein